VNGALTTAGDHLPSFELWFAVRYLHVASVALLVGGALVMCGLCLVLAGDTESSVLSRITTLYEWLFWSVIGVTVVTGISNLGLKGEGLMPAASSWGRALTVKLSLAILVLCLALLRSDVVIRLRGAAVGGSARANHVLASLYGATVVLFLAVLWVGLGLAHGRY
jgi:hypothetical protein